MNAPFGLAAALLVLGATTLFAAPKPAPGGTLRPSHGMASNVVSSGCRTTEMHVIAGGGIRMQGAGGWTMDGTAGQPEATVATGSSGLRMEGGFWRAVLAPADEIFCNDFD